MQSLGVYFTRAAKACMHGRRRQGSYQCEQLVALASPKLYSFPAGFGTLLIFSCSAPPFGTHINNNNNPSAWIQALRTDRTRARTESKGYEARKNVHETGKRETGATKEAFLFGLYIVIQGRMSTIDSSYRCMVTATSSPALFSDFPY